MIRRSLRPIALAACLVFLTGSVSSCGYILHPERRGQRGGMIHTETLVFDLLWLIPGILPGVIALIVDFTSGAIYAGGGRAHKVNGKTKVAVRLPKVEAETRLELRVMTRDGRVLDRTSATLKPDGSSPPALTLDLAKAIEVAKLLGEDAKELIMVLKGETGPTAKLHLQVQ